MKIVDEILNILFPPICGFCGKIDRNYICTECERKINQKCIYKLYYIKDKYFEEHAYIMNYEGIIRDKILEYKFKDKSYMYKTFAKIILKNNIICEILKKCDIITFVPIHKKRKNERGYNQSELIAREIAKDIKTLKYVNALKKIKNTPKQSSLNKKERTDNVKNTYEMIRREIITNKKIVLFDDIYTTGATANECAKLLKQNGAKYILVLSLAK